MFRSRLFISAAALGIACTAAPLQAQDDAGSVPEDAQDNSFGDIVVTAERREQNIQRTSVAVSVRDGEDLLDQGRYSVREILEDVPSVSLIDSGVGTASDNPANRIAIRGVAASGNIPADLAPTSAATAYYVDGVLNGIGGNYDLAAVQVVRGPMGTLYGRSATAGAVLINTINPAFGYFGADFSLELGNYGLKHASGGVNIPLGDRAAVRASGNAYMRDGYYAREGGKEHSYDGRIRLLFEATENLTLQLGFAALSNDLYSGELQGHLTDAGGVAYDIPTSLGTGKEESQQYWAQIDLDLGGVILTWIPALRDYSMEATSYTGQPNGGEIENYQVVPKDRFHTQELRLTSDNDSPLQWQTGLFYYDNDLTVSGFGRTELPPPPADPNAPPPPPPDPNAPPPPTVYLYLFDNMPQQRSTENLGLFAEGTYAFSDSTRLTAGLRYDHTKVQAEQLACNGVVVGDGDPVNCLTLGGAAGRRSWENLTYKVRLEQDLTPDNLVYASVSSAFIPGSIGVTTGVDPNDVSNLLLSAAPYEPEEVTAFEVGSKNRFANGDLILNLAGFYYDYENHQLPVQTGLVFPNPNEPPVVLYATLGSPAKMWGAEAELIVQPSDQDRIALSANYTDAYYVDKPQPFALGVTNREFAGVVPWQVSALYEHEFELTADRSLTVSGQLIYNSEFLVSDLPVNAANLRPFATNDEALRINLNVTIDILENATLSAYLRNLTDVRRLAVVGVADPGNVAGNTASSTAPRTFGAVLSFHY